MRRVFAIFLALFLISPVFALNLTTISFEKDISKNLELLTADKTKVLVTTFSTKKGSTEEVPIWIINANNLSNVSLSILYDKNVIKPEEILPGDFNISYSSGDKITMELNLNESYSGDLLLAKTVFRAIGEEGESSPLEIEVYELLNNNSTQIPYTTIDGTFVIERTSTTEEKGGGDKLDPTLEGLMEAENQSKYAEENDLNLTDGKVKVEITTDEGKEQKTVDIEDLQNLTENQSIQKIEPYREFNWKNYLIPIILIIIILILALIYKELT